MAWARLDDAFDDHPKVLALLDMDGAAAAIGLWTLCLTYAHRNTRKKGKTPGLIPFTLPRRFFGPEGRSMAALLVEVGLWDEAEDGWMIHDFAEYLPAKEVSEARSAAGRKGAAKRWGGKPTPPDGKGMAEPKQVDDKPMAPQKQDDGTLPSDDGSLPFDDDNAVASDGSRARARRDRVDVRTTVLSPNPGPEPVPPSAAEPAARHGADPFDAIDGLSVTQRSKRITDAYAAVEPMCKWPAINGIVIKALNAAKWADSEIRDGLLRLGKEGRTVSVETLRLELQGIPPREPPGVARQARSTTDQRVADAQALKQVFRATTTNTIRGELAG